MDSTSLRGPALSSSNPRIFCALPIVVLYKPAQVGEYRADFLVDSKIILEIKATSALIAAHHAQALHYPTATGLRLALLLNFGAQSLQFKRIIL
jgi:GxxExxY protein